MDAQRGGLTDKPNCPKRNERVKQTSARRDCLRLVPVEVWMPGLKAEWSLYFKVDMREVAKGQRNSELDKKPGCPRNSCLKPHPGPVPFPPPHQGSSLDTCSSRHVGHLGLLLSASCDGGKASTGRANSTQGPNTVLLRLLPPQNICEIKPTKPHGNQHQALPS